MEDLRGVQEALNDWAHHVSECDYCYRNRKLLPRGLLLQTCVERRREARKAVA
jgi:hypothetical protein